MCKLIKIKKVYTRYVIGITVKQFSDLLVVDQELDDAGKDMVYTQLEKVPGIGNVDYDGHFGSQIFLDVDADKDRPVLWKVVDLIFEKAGIYKLEK